VLTPQQLCSRQLGQQQQQLAGREVQQQVWLLAQVLAVLLQWRLQVTVTAGMSAALGVVASTAAWAAHRHSQCSSRNKQQCCLGHKYSSHTNSSSSSSSKV
jgi:hypothetical protein